MGRKVFISVLGAGLYGKCKYVDGTFSSKETFFVQTATLEYLRASEWSENDIGLFLLTEKARKDNWDKNISSRRDNRINQNVEYKGLEKDIEELKLPIKICDLPIPDGNNEAEIWDIFSKTFELIQDDDELYFDVTHAFRFLPMLILVLCDYSKFLKNTQIKSITYGNYEARDQKKTPNEAQIVNLLPISQLQDWTFAAGQYMNGGNVTQLVKLCEDEFKPILQTTGGTDESARNLRDFAKNLYDVIEQRMACRGKDIIEAKSFKKLKEASKRVETSLFEPLKPIFDKIQKTFDLFDENENIANGYAAAKWCFNNGLYQQSATILQEVVVSYVCKRHDIDIYDDTQRDIVNGAFNIAFQKNKADEPRRECDETKKNKIKDVLNDDIFKDYVIVNGFNNLTEVRNDFNHSGMRSRRKPMKSSDIKNNIGKCIDILSVLFEK